MNPAHARRLIEDTFTRPYDRVRFQNFMRNLVNRIDETKAFSRNIQYVKDAFKPHVQRFERLGTYTSPDKEIVDVLVVHLTQESKLERARTALRNFVADHLKTRDEKDAALVAFVSPTEAQWRFSYVKMEYATVKRESGKVGVEERLTPARRFSFLVGEGESCHTAQTRFLKLLEEDQADPTLAQIEDAFSVEAVTKEFFTRYAALFADIHAALEELVARDKVIRDEFNAKGVNTVDFAKKLLGQIVFLYFLQKKGWLGVEKGKDWGSGPRDFLRRLVDRSDPSDLSDPSDPPNIFNDILEPLFYDTLATDRGHEAWCRRFNCRIPFLNGGLFEPLADYDWKKTDILIPNKLFTNDDCVEEGITGTGVLDVFDRYNFTVNEAEPLEQEVAIDPEMLGKVFENLIEENRRKGLGAFYTPREIVHYMCQESLINYLAGALNDLPDPSASSDCIPRADLETFVRLGEQISHYAAVATEYAVKMPKNIMENARALDDALKTITVCDPAVGSGAFPVGMLTEIVRARTALTPFFNDVAERTPYYFKRHVIQNCLYGVDIDSSAVEIAKLRLWLSLVVDEEDAKQIKPLPNLDYKIVVGNSLLGVERGVLENWKAIRRFEQLRSRFFDPSTQAEKSNLRHEINAIIHELTHGNQTFDFEIFFSEVFHAKQGFDVIIANPPYVRQEKIKEQKAALKAAGYECFSGTADLFVYFYERGVKLLRPGGALTLITSNKYYRAGYGKALRRFLACELTLHRLIDFGDAPVFEAIAYASILTAIRTKPANDSAALGYTWEQGQPFERISQIVAEQGQTIAQCELKPEGWRLESPFVFRLLEKIRRAGTPLGEYVNGRFYYGIKTGLNEAFVVDRATRDRLIREDKSSAEILKPFLRGRDVKRWRCEPKDLWLIFTRRGIDIRRYPAVHEHLKQFRERLSKRAGEQAWYELQASPGDTERFEQPKIVIPAIANSTQYVADSRGYFSNDKTSICVSNELHFLLALLNSNTLWWFIRHTAASKQGGFYEFKPMYVAALPIPAASVTDKARLTELAERAAEQTEAGDAAGLRATERETDAIVYRLFDLTPDEIAHIEKSLDNTRRKAEG